MILSQKEKIRADYESYIDYAEERGMARGIEKEKIDIIKTALITGLNEEVIIKIAKISKEKLEEIKNENCNTKLDTFFKRNLKYKKITIKLALY